MEPAIRLVNQSIYRANRSPRAPHDFERRGLLPIGGMDGAGRAACDAGAAAGLLARHDRNRGGRVILAGSACQGTNGRVGSMCRPPTRPENRSQRLTYANTNLTTTGGERWGQGAATDAATAYENRGREGRPSGDTGGELTLRDACGQGKRRWMKGAQPGRSLPTFPSNRQHT